MAKMDKETEEYFGNFFEMFNSEGWKQFIAHIANDIEGHKMTIWQREDKDFPFYKGQVMILDRIAHFENFVRNQYDQYVESLEEEDDSE